MSFPPAAQVTAAPPLARPGEASPRPGLEARQRSGPEEGHVQRVSAQEKHARLAQLFRDHHAFIWRAVRRLGADPEVAADMTQQAYLIAAERFDDLKVGSERAFLFATAIGLAKTLHRRERRCQLEGDMDDVSLLSGAEETDRASVDGVARRHDAQLLLQRVLSKMEPDVVTVFCLFELEGISAPEIAQLLEVPVGTVASRLRRARLQFREEATRLEQVVRRRGGHG
jgi:RNA polymerase sigma-70 factor (ECF subfamily)